MPLELERIVARAMANEVEERYSSAADLWHELRAVRSSLFAGASDPLPRMPEVTLVKPPQPTAQPRLSLRPASLIPAPPEDKDGSPRQQPRPHEWDE